MKVSEHALREAALWAVESAEGLSEQQQHQFDQWLQLEANQLAWLRIKQVNTQLNCLSEETLASVSANSLRAGSTASRRRFLFNIAAISSGIGLSAYMAPYGLRQWQLANATLRSEQTLITKQLSDGSKIWLKSHSTVNINIDTSTRQLALLKDEIYIATGKDVRPFSFPTHFNEKFIDVIPIGTEFNVKLRNDRLVISVFDGLVKVKSQGIDYAISANQQMVIDNDFHTQVIKANINFCAWRDSVFFADNTSLPDLFDVLEDKFDVRIFSSAKVKSLAISGTIPMTTLSKSLAIIAVTLSLNIRQVLSSSFYISKI